MRPGLGRLSAALGWLLGSSWRLLGDSWAALGSSGPDTGPRDPSSQRHARRCTQHIARAYGDAQPEGLFTTMLDVEEGIEVRITMGSWVVTWGYMLLAWR